MASVVNISIDQGSTFTYVFELANTAALNLSGATPIGALAPEWDEAANATPFTCQLLGSNVVISLTDTQTKNLTANSYFPVDDQTWVYDVSIVDATNNAIRVVQGRAHINPRVTQFP